jgi:predicted acetyltransferase
MKDIGMCVDKVLRGKGLGMEIIKKRLDLCKEVEVKVNMKVFNEVKYKVMEKRVGMEVLEEVW